MAITWSSKNITKPINSLYYVGPEDGTKVVRLGDKYATLPSIDGIISGDPISESLEKKSIDMTTYQRSLFCS